MKVSTAGEGLLVNTLMMPVGNDSVISPVIFTMHLLGTVKLVLQVADVADVVCTVCMISFIVYLLNDCISLLFTVKRN